MKPRLTPLLASAIFLLNVFLNAPLFMRGELPFRGSIEGGYVSMARFIANHPNPWGWNPLQYAGLPTQFMYVPGLSYLTALFTWITPLPVDYAYRLLTATFVCLGPVTAFLLAVYFTRSRWWPLAAALFYSLVSPSYSLFLAVEKDRGLVHLPWRIQVLAKYGEGPHNTGLMLLPLTLLALWFAATSGAGLLACQSERSSEKRGPASKFRAEQTSENNAPPQRGFSPPVPGFPAAAKAAYPRVFLAALLLAAIPLTNWVAAFALAISAIAFLLAAWGEPDFSHLRALAAAALAYLLACFWLTPSFIQTIAFNWPADSFGYKLLSAQKLLVIGLIASALALRLVLHFAKAPFYFRLVSLACLAFGWITTSWYVGGVDTIPESRRYAIEFELFLALTLAEALRLGWNSANDTFRFCAKCCAAVLLIAGAPQIATHLTQGWSQWTPVPRAQTVEFQIAQWIAQHRPGGRVFASGGLRFRLNSWYDLPQVGGGFETGLTNRIPYEMAYRVRTATGLRPGREAADTINFLKALDAQYVVVNGPASQEYYRDFKRPDRLNDLRIIYRQNGDTIYTLPFRPMATLVQPSELPAGDPNSDPALLEHYVAAIDDASRPQLLVRRPGPAAINIDGNVPAGSLISVRENAAPGWRATENNLPIPITQDKLGYLVLHPVGGDLSHIELRYNGTAEQRIMAVVCALAWLVSLAVVGQASSLSIRALARTR